MRYLSVASPLLIGLSMGAATNKQTRRRRIATESPLRNTSITSYKATPQEIVDAEVEFQVMAKVVE